ncbi:MAG: hypothetical protein QME14_06705 [Methanobacteriaceae archaeon]|nr:hypothetical protein [Methanobacteriaceae archaeon]
MANTWDPLAVINLVFCIIIVLLGAWCYTKKNNNLALYISIGFGLFGVSHFAVLIGADSSSISLVIIRSLGYLVVILAVLKEAVFNK